MNRILFDRKAAIFDLDGTLIDSMDVWEKIDEDFLKKRGFDLSPDYTEAVRTMGFAEAARYTIDHFSLQQRPEEIVEEWNEMALSEYGHSIDMKPGAKPLLQRLKLNGVKIALATASAKPLYEAVLRRHNVYSLFDAFVALDEVARSKSHPDIYLLAASRLMTAPADCAVFEDVLAGVIGAKSAGMEVFGVYDSKSASEKPAIIETADHYLESLDELLQVIS